MNNQTPEEWKSHIKSIVIEGMNHSIEALNHEIKQECLFDFLIRNLENGIAFLKNERKEK
jgi:hypothetical protein